MEYRILCPSSGYDGQMRLARGHYSGPGPLLCDGCGSDGHIMVQPAWSRSWLCRACVERPGAPMIIRQ